VIYTDSLIEAAGRDGALLGHEGLLRLARSVGAKEPIDFARRLVDAVADYRAGRPPDDDLTVVVLHRTDEQTAQAT